MGSSPRLNFYLPTPLLSSFGSQRLATGQLVSWQPNVGFRAAREWQLL
jgi:hypothetical protein